ncbi:MAG TPA: 50S ribosomal protein L23 [Candidatus Omnitrophica bacterium]|nr:MAG: 50S ribosomal protein L23 [Candidatus Omnitrophota bacterium]RKY42718.1 MAG: 50S ribosomal protein L23 [Candidatus Omnitrophota bacterium]HEC69093.1 50S ribosomal protein L23 [Candidatus Omnitrophota bacterium]
MRDPYLVIKSPLLTERLDRLQPQNIYGFWVDKNANKIEVKYAIEKIYNVKVVKVNIMNMPPKRRRLRFKEGHTASWKKAIVRIKEGQTINIG